MDKNDVPFDYMVAIEKIRKEKRQKKSGSMIRNGFRSGRTSRWTIWLP